jgi:hypothetical protein
MRGFEITATGGSSILNVQILRTSSYSNTHPALEQTPDGYQDSS